LHERSAYEAEPFLLLLVVMGGSPEEEPFEYLSDAIWHFDTECIVDHGDYAAIARRMSVLSGGDLPFEEVQDFIEIENEEAWLSLVLDGKAYRFDAAVDEDWVDEEIL
jgi:hypothetical protein